jgi:hypothetical protein
MTLILVSSTVATSLDHAGMAAQRSNGAQLALASEAKPGAPR